MEATHSQGTDGQTSADAHDGPALPRKWDGTSVWLKMYDIHPNETKAIAIEDLIQLKTPDEKGNTFPQTTTHGEVSWWAQKRARPRSRPRRPIS